MAPIHILVADDHPIVADGLRMLLESVDGFEVVGTVHNGWQALDFITANPVDVVLTDYQMPVLSGLAMASKARERDLKTRLIMLTMNEDPQCIRDALEVGMAGYVVKSAEKPELIKAIRSVHAGERYLSSRIQRKLSESSNPRPTDEPTTLDEVTALTRRELEILKLITDGLTNIEIGEQLYISSTTVETHRRNLMKKVGVSTAIGLMRWGLRHGLVEFE
ncbi:response regulator [Fibrella sp. WM1]|uniref:response regulator n=1 Tax=Fibrella musci TaxID=3242485 RepID=UPI00351F8DE3